MASRATESIKRLKSFKYSVETLNTTPLRGSVQAR
jgi:hypothetical protein